MSVLGTEAGAWIPSLDDTGNGTTTLHNTGSAGGDATLTNMDAATDWVADTGSGGVRALDFDGSNDYVDAGAGSAFIASTMSLSLWVKSSGSPINFHGVMYNSTRPGGTWNAGWALIWFNSSTLRFWKGTWNTNHIDITVATTTNWNHIAIRVVGTAITAYLNGTQTGTNTAANASATAPANLIFGQAHSNSFSAAGRLDGIRYFASDIGTAGVAELYSAGAGRSIGGSTPASSPVSSLTLMGVG